MRGLKIEDQLALYGRSSASRLLLGTARYDSPFLLAEAISAADPAMLTVSLRRQLSGSKNSGQSFWNLLRETQRPILPNTAGCLSAREAIKTACMARELFQTDLIKLEVIGDELNLQPDPCMWRFDVSEGTGESKQPGTIREKWAENTHF